MHRRTLLPLAAACLTPATGQGQPAPPPLVVLADPGLAEPLRALDQLWRANGGRPLRLVLAPAAALVRQLEQGTTCDLLALPEPSRMDELAQRRLVRPEGRRSALGNELWIITPANQPVPRRLLLTVELPALLPPGARLAVPEPTASATGRHVQLALAGLGVADALRTRQLRLPDGRAVAQAVARGEAPLGIVSATEAQGIPGLRLAAVVPAEAHPPMATGFALCRRSEAAAELLAFLLADDALAVWTRLGFGAR